MKRLIPILFLVLLLAGCSLGDDYLSMEPHVEPPSSLTEPTEEPVPVVSSRLELRGAILSLIDNWKEQDTILIRDYDGDVTQDLNEIMDYATRQHPTGAYAVDYADAEILEKNGQQTVQVSFVFRRSISEINAIILVDSSDDADAKIKEALTTYATSLTLRIRRYSDRDFAGEILDYCMKNPRTIPCIPDFSLKLYPEEGEHRILELHLTYPESKDVMREKLLELETTFHSAITYGKTGNTPLEKATRLCNYLIRRRDQRLTDTTPKLPVYDLLARNIGHDLSYAICYNDLCTSLGVSCQIVTGTRNGLPYYWNILVFEDQVFHVDLRQYIEQGIMSMTPLYDEGLLAVGYEWDQNLYPLAPDPNAEETTAPSDGEEGTSPGNEDGSVHPDSTPVPTTEPQPTETETDPATQSDLPSPDVPRHSDGTHTSEGTSPDTASP